MYFRSFDYLINLKKRNHKYQKYSILFLILLVIVSYRILYTYEENLNNVLKRYESINSSLKTSKEYNNNVKQVIENASFLSNILSSNDVNGNIVGSAKESQLLLNGDQNLVSNIIQDISKSEKLSIRDMEFYIRGSGNKEAKLTFGEYIHEE